MKKIIIIFIIIFTIIFANYLININNYIYDVKEISSEMILISKSGPIFSSIGLASPGKLEFTKNFEVSLNFSKDNSLTNAKDREFVKIYNIINEKKIPFKKTIPLKFEEVITKNDLKKNNQVDIIFYYVTYLVNKNYSVKKYKSNNIDNVQEYEISGTLVYKTLISDKSTNIKINH